MRYVDNIDIGSNKSRVNNSTAEQEEANTSKHSHDTLVTEQPAGSYGNRKPSETHH